MSEWEEKLWIELNEMSSVDQVKATATWIADITHRLLPQLAARRRQAILLAITLPDWDAQRLAETIGSRRTTISRLAEEARKDLRESGDAPTPVS
jgi:DNA-directed RNA polymerase specialized sigma24 family protein